MGTVQKIRSPGGEEMILLSLEDYEDLLDAKAATSARAELAHDGETLSSEDVKEALASPTPLAFWRRKRGVSQQELAATLGTSQGYVSDVESGRRVGSIGFYRKTAEALRLRVDDIAPDDGEESPKPGLPLDDIAAAHAGKSRGRGRAREGDKQKS